MRFTVRNSIDAPRDRVWAALADFGEIATWNTGIDASRIISGPDTGMGAERQCDFGNRYLREKIQQWEPPERLALEFTHFPAPLRAAVTFRLTDNGATQITAHYWYQGKGPLRPLAWIMHPLLRNAITNLLRDLKTHVESQQDRDQGNK